MKVIQIVTQMEAGGAQGVACCLHDGFAAAGLHSELWFLYQKRASHTGPRIRSLAAHRPGPLGTVGLLLRLWWWLRREAPDCVMTHTHYANVIGLLLAKLAFVKRRIAVQHNPSATYPSFARTLDRIWGTLGIYTSIVAVCDTVVHSLAGYPKIYQRRVRRIYNGSQSGAAILRSEARSALNIPADRLLLLNVGRLSKQKNQQVLLRTLAEMPDAFLIIAGDGELRNELISQARNFAVEDRVHFAGEVGRDRLAQFLSAADLFVFPSRFEAMPLAVLEALHYGLPVVASDIPALSEILAGSGVLVAGDDPHVWSRTISGLLKDAGLCHALRHKGRVRAADFSVPQMIHHYLQLIRLSEQRA